MLSDKFKTKEKILYDFTYMNFRIGKTNQSCLPEPGDEKRLTRKENNRTFRSEESVNIKIRVMRFSSIHLKWLYSFSTASLK